MIHIKKIMFHAADGLKREIYDRLIINKCYFVLSMMKEVQDYEKAIYEHIDYRMYGILHSDHVAHVIVAMPYKFDVISRLDHGWQNVSKLTLVTPPKTTYRQRADPFNPRGIVVRVTFRNGKTQDLHHEDLMIYAGEQGMRSYEDGVRVLQGFRFSEAGKKILL